MTTKAVLSKKIKALTLCQKIGKGIAKGFSDEESGEDAGIPGGEKEVQF